jgi:hypothetical protein
MPETHGEVKIRQNAPVGPRGAKLNKQVPNGGWNVARLILKTLKGQPYYVKDDGLIIKIAW